jgi:hypothetical protein
MFFIQQFHFCYCTQIVYKSPHYQYIYIFKSQNLHNTTTPLHYNRIHYLYNATTRGATVALHGGEGITHLHTEGYFQFHITLHKNMDMRFQFSNGLSDVYGRVFSIQHYIT